MAYTEIMPVKGEMNQITKITFESAGGSTEGFVFKLPNAGDEYLTLLVQNAGSGTTSFTVKKPETGSYCASSKDETFEMGTLGFGVFRFESAKWANHDGTVKCVPATATVKMAVVY